MPAAVFRDTPASQVFLAVMASPVSPESPADPDVPAVHQLCARRSTSRRAVPAHPAHQDPVAQMASQATLADLDNLAAQETLATPAHLARKAHLDPPESPDAMEPAEIPADQPSQHPTFLETPVCPETLDLKVFPETPDPLVATASPATRAHLARPAHPATQAATATRDRKARPASLAHRESAVFARNTARSMAVFSSKMAREESRRSGGRREWRVSEQQHQQFRTQHQHQHHFRNQRIVSVINFARFGNDHHPKKNVPTPSFAWLPLIVLYAVLPSAGHMTKKMSCKMIKHTCNYILW